ncbi:uncharacterized protein EI90DRAFT_3032263 [Cantharellus anzutake]|uniref:uncharacterized protein n=1 Tax=Cantharellus anzutake TaxID=1750568 RepID=UPI00190399FA|nr:uncharacterized protein EI90DRAFT_3032263 [Cantharellus anzutake]KAF8342144.1 hypothetical protein EI90DRAFT_3032263 [Cantharellus anzutake]
MHLKSTSRLYLAILRVILHWRSYATWRSSIRYSRMFARAAAKYPSTSICLNNCANGAPKPSLRFKIWTNPRVPHRKNKLESCTPFMSYLRT